MEQIFKQFRYFGEHSLQNNITKQDLLTGQRFENYYTPIVQLGIPILLIVLGTFDLGKAVISSEEKEVKAAQSRLLKRFLYAALVFFVATIVSVLMSVIAQGGEGDTTSWENCWRAAG